MTCHVASYRVAGHSIQYLCLCMLLAVPSLFPIIIMLSVWRTRNKSGLRLVRNTRQLDGSRAVTSQAKPYYDVVDLALLCAEVC